MATRREPVHDDCEVRLEPDRHDALHPELDAWRANVGPPAVLDGAPDAAKQLSGIDVLSWNVAIGLGRLDRVLDELRTRGDIGQAPDRPLVVLLQEAFRGGDAVPGSAGSAHHGGRLARAAGRVDVVDIARMQGMSLRYSPSMRNGLHPSDRGNAVLSTVRLAAARAVLLPYVRQRRVAVSAAIAGHESLSFVSAHLDTHGQPRIPNGRRRFGAGRTHQAQALASTLDTLGGSVVLGADLNTVLGMSDPAVRALVAAGMHPARRVGEWRHTFRRLRLLLDHVLFYSPDGRIAHAEVTRLDDGDRSDTTVFGSDHHPLLARIELRER